MREYYSWKMSVRGPEPHAGCWQPGTGPVWHPVSVHWLGLKHPPGGWNEPGATWTRLHAAEPSRTRIPSCDVTPFVSFYLPGSGFGGRHDGNAD